MKKKTFFIDFILEKVYIVLFYGIGWYYVISWVLIEKILQIFWFFGQICPFLVKFANFLPCSTLRTSCRKVRGGSSIKWFLKTAQPQETFYVHFVNIWLIFISLRTFLFWSIKVDNPVRCGLTALTDQRVEVV